MVFIFCTILFQNCGKAVSFKINFVYQSMFFGFHCHIIIPFFFYLSIEFIVYLSMVTGILCFFFMCKHHEIPGILVYAVSLNTCWIFYIPQNQAESLAVATCDCSSCKGFSKAALWIMSISGLRIFPPLGSNPKTRHEYLPGPGRVEKCADHAQPCNTLCKRSLSSWGKDVLGLPTDDGTHKGRSHNAGCMLSASPQASWPTSGSGVQSKNGKEIGH